MRKLALLVVALLTLGVGTAAAQIDPSGMRLSSPREAAGGSLFWVRSVTPCPPAPAPHIHRYVEVWVAPQAGILRQDLSEVIGDVDDRGHWEVSLTAPASPGAGATAHHYVRAACLEDDPWAAAPLDEDTGIKPEAVAYYEVNPLWATSAEAGEAGPPSEFIPDPDRYEVVTTTTAPRETTTTTAAPSTSTIAPGVATAAGADSGGAAVVDDSKARIDAARAELAAAGVDVSMMSDGEVLASSARTAAPPADGGIPWWAFGLAAILAISGIVAFGVRRTSVLDQLDR